MMVYPFGGRRDYQHPHAPVHAASITSASISIPYLSHHAYPTASVTALLA